MIAGHKGQSEVVKNKGRKGRRRRLKGQGGRGILEKERPPVFGMIQRGGQVVISLLANVKQKTVEPFIKETISPGRLCTRTNTAFMPAYVPGDTTIRASTMEGASTPEMKMGMAFVKSM